MEGALEREKKRVGLREGILVPDPPPTHPTFLLRSPPPPTLSPTTPSSTPFPGSGVLCSVAVAILTR